MRRIPEKIGKYKIVQLVAKGGMGAVYKGVHPTLNRYVILKKLTLRGASVVERFKREAEILMDFRHDNIVVVYDHFKAGNSYYIVLEYVDGISLDKLIGQERLVAEPVALYITLEVCRSLQYAHDKGVVHRDIKPANILISKGGEIKLVDFGIAAYQDQEEEDSDDSLTREGMTLGTPSYMSPEQIESTKGVDRRADIYSLGVMLYEVLCGKKPYPGTFTAEAINMIQKGKHTSLQKVNPNISWFARRFVKKCMQTKPKRRFQTLKPAIKKLKRRLKRIGTLEVFEALKAAVTGEEISSDFYHFKKSAFGKFAVAVFLVLVLGGGGFWSYRQGWVYRVVSPDTYGALDLSVLVRKGFKLPEETFINGALFYDDIEEIPRVEGVSFRFSYDKERETEDHYYFKSSRKILPVGFYRVKVNVENKVFWQSFYISAFSAASISQAESRSVEVVLDKVPPLPLRSEITVTDQSTGADITSLVNIEIARGGEWISYNETIRSELVTDSVYTFRISKEGYLARSYSLRIDPYQSILSLNAELMPKPGTLVLSSNEEGMKITVNGEDHYLSGGTDRSYLSFGRTASGEAKEYVLSPGAYLIKITKGSVQEQISFDIDPGEIQNVRAVYHKEDKRIQLDLE